MSFFSCSSSLVSAGLKPALSSFRGFSFFSFSFLVSGAGSSATGAGVLLGTGAFGSFFMKKPFLGSNPFTTLQASMY
eukprot:CAMPEP_0171056370 /NCGR_PEP_ID=MMETSP0766_2-20121228/861_1 /TAXON_ID=439317 /ORGANISM="Gambierdiscus australes, Strain CAWD 149" /LENGTH=76 /DNA_ID=CAMNT_0011511247 /DNA_START=66 /DNA_END=296 /DNA_ORIENTATION=-